MPDQPVGRHGRSVGGQQRRQHQPHLRLRDPDRPVGALGISLIVGSAPDERAGAAAALAETSGEFGIAFGIAALGSVGAAAYGALIAVPAGVPDGAAAAARESIGDAVAAAEGIPSGPALLDAARDAFLGGFGVVAAVGAALLLGLAALTAALLRHLPPIGSADR